MLACGCDRTDPQIKALHVSYDMTLGLGMDTLSQAVHPGQELNGRLYGFLRADLRRHVVRAARCHSGVES